MHQGRGDRSWGAFRIPYVGFLFRCASDPGIYKTENGAAFSPAILARFDAIVFSNTSGDVSTPDQRAAFKGFVENGGGWVGIHAAKDSEHPYTTPKDRPFAWIRGYHLGGRSITWGRQSYRMSEMDLQANRQDGFGCDWPIRYDDLARWYDHVEKFVGVAGSKEGLPQLPDGEFIPRSR